MKAGRTVKRVLARKGHNMQWLLQEMSKADPAINITAEMLEAITTGKRSMNFDEMQAFCKVTGISPETFISETLEA